MIQINDIVGATREKARLEWTRRAIILTALSKHFNVDENKIVLKASSFIERYEIVLSLGFFRKKKKTLLEISSNLYTGTHIDYFGGDSMSGKKIIDAMKDYASKCTNSNIILNLRENKEKKYWSLW